MHLGLMGTHGTGKTTFAQKLYADLVKSFPHEIIRLVSGTARQCERPVNRLVSEDTQHWIFLHHMKCENEAKYGDMATMLICDRTCLDSLAYAQVAGFTDLVDACFTMALYWLEKEYTEIILFPPREGCLKEDGFRDTDPAFQEAVHNVLIDWIHAYHLPVTIRSDHNGNK